jgi:hypothetical protein
MPFRQVVVFQGWCDFGANNEKNRQNKINAMEGNNHEVMDSLRNMKRKAGL